ncbi:outer membrane protein assembly factor BamD [Labilithrix luteola]|uniref:outer membrane protein assembly factor BamD n=1 Tax=Labilithrix luteola TaxID=1391654 RepID=UPI0011BA5B67|nr:outer membrane protein assembly factor BamD [Labilithrix luteola]
MKAKMVYTRKPMAPARRSHSLLGALCIGALGAAGLVGIAGLTGCETPEPRSALSYAADAERAYNQAMEEFTSHNWIEAQSLFREVKRKYSYSKFARLAELRIADADFEQEKYAEAIREYRQFVHDHRSDVEEVGYARARIAEAQYKQISESFLLPSADERDQAVILDAYKELKGYVHDYPTGKDSQKIRELLADVTARLMRHELYVARFYLQRDNFDAAVLRIQYAMRNFALGPQLAPATPGKQPRINPNAPEPVDSGLEAEALLLLGEVYLKMHKFGDARDTFNAILHDYPKSPLTVQANNYLDYMRERGV